MLFFFWFSDGPRPNQKEMLSLRAFLLLFVKQLIIKVSLCRNKTLTFSGSSFKMVCELKYYAVTERLFSVRIVHVFIVDHIYLFTNNKNIT